MTDISIGDGESAVLVHVPVGTGSSFGLYAWPASRVLAEHVWLHRGAFAGKRCVELGAGASLVSVVAAKLGAHVTLTDKAGAEDVLDQCRAMCAVNGVDATTAVVPLSWGVFTAEVVALTGFDVLLAADVLYDSRDFEAVVATLHFFMRKNPAMVALVAYQQRSVTKTLGPLLVQWQLKAEVVPEDTCCRPGWPPVELPLAHSVCVLRITATAPPSAPPSAPPPPPLPPASPRACFAKDGLVVMTGVLDSATLAAARREVDALYVGVSAAALEAQDCVLDLLDDVGVPPTAAARVDCAAFSDMRQRAGGTPAVTGGILGGLAAGVQAVCGWPAVFHFSTHFVVKPPGSVSEFRWHRDADLQLAMCPTQQPYASLWCALDDTHPGNGSLTLLPASTGLAPADVDDTRPQADPPGAVTVTVAAGDAVLFDSTLWHRSGPNTSPHPRRVLYVQYSPAAIMAPDGRAPLCFAVPCTGAP